MTNSRPHLAIRASAFGFLSSFELRHSAVWKGLSVPRPELVLHRPRLGCKLSIILLDWGVRESFHSLHYLNQQTVERGDYELIWLEFYQRQPLKLQEMVFRQGPGAPPIDQWIVAGYDKDIIFNKHRLYNLGLLLARGRHCVFCDSDAIFTPQFV